jgi:predicted HAD superfamily Cof-like phosphohydrolase
MTLNDAINAVRDFHHLQRVSETQRRAAEEIPISTQRILLDMARTIQQYADQLEKGGHICGLAGLRGHLSAEEFAEWIFALLAGDEEAMLDALADRLYVLLGDAVSYDLPLSDAFDEVHRSNMTKEKQPDDPSTQRVRSKGPRYEAPDIKGVLDAHRN